MSDWRITSTGKPSKKFISMLNKFPKAEMDYLKALKKENKEKFPLTKSTVNSFIQSRKADIKDLSKTYPNSSIALFALIKKRFPDLHDMIEYHKMRSSFRLFESIEKKYVKPTKPKTRKTVKPKTRKTVKKKSKIKDSRYKDIKIVKDNSNWILSEVTQPELGNIPLSFKTKTKAENFINRNLNDMKKGKTSLRFNNYLLKKWGKTRAWNNKFHTPIKQARKEI